MQTTSNYALRLPASLKREVENVARTDGTSLNQFIVTAVAEKLATMRTVDYFNERAARADVAAALAIVNRAGGTAPRSDDILPPD
jgi:hypothetical protein